MLPVQIDHVEIGLSRLLEQWKNSPKIQGLLRSYLEQSNELESVAFEVLTERGIFEAVGVNLDVIGALFDISRDGRTDEQYRAAILNYVTTLNGDGTTEVFMQALRAVSGSDFVDFFEHPSGDVHAWLGDGFTVFTYPDLEDLVPAGVNLRIYVDDGFDSFTGTELVQNTNILQLNTLDTVEVTDGVDVYDLQVQSNDTSNFNSDFAVLPEIIDNVEEPYLAELLFSAVQTTTGNIVDDLNNFVVDNVNNNIIWIDYNF